MSELQQRKRPWYTEDILYIIAKGLLARIPDGLKQINFCHQNCYTFFMGHNEMATRVIISQFAKFKRIVFTKSFEGEKQIQFYKKKDDLSWEDLRSEEFGGPYIVPPGMLEYIIENGKLRVNTIDIFDFLPDDHSTDIKECGEMNSLKAFCALFLGKQVQIPDGLNNNLLIKNLSFLNESVVGIENNFETILAIDAAELGIFNISDNIIIDCSQYKSPIIAKNTTKITINCRFNLKSSKEELNKFATNFETFCFFLVRVCPNLKNLHIEIRSWLNFLDSIVFSDNLYSTIKAMEAGIKSIKIGNEHLQISVKLIDYLPSIIYDDLPIQSHDLFKLGSPFTPDGFDDDDEDDDDEYPDFDDEERYIARSLEIVDVLGRIHKLHFKIEEEYDSDESDSMDTSDDDDDENDEVDENGKDNDKEEEDGDEEKEVDEEEDNDDDEVVEKKKMKMTD